MSEALIGEIRWFPYERGAPRDWHLCDGSLLAVDEHDALFSLIGTQFGGDGQATFAIPDLRGRVAVHQGGGPGLTERTVGEKGGRETVTLQSGQLPHHEHVVQASTASAQRTDPKAAVHARLATDDGLYLDAVAGKTPIPFPDDAVTSAGDSQPHDNCGPTLALAPCICLYGFYPTQN